LIVAVLGAVGMVALGWWAREAMRKDPQATARVLFSGEPEGPVQVEPAGLARRVDVDLLYAGSVAWTQDGRAVALCGMPGMSFRRLVQPPQQVSPWDIPKAQEEQRRRVREMMASRVFLLDTTTGTSRTIPTPESGAEAEEVAWWPDGRLLVFTGPALLPSGDEPRDEYGLRKLWLVNPTDNQAEKVAELKGWPYLTPGDRGVVFTMNLAAGKRHAYVLLPAGGRPLLKELPTAGESTFTWDSRGALFVWGTPPKGQRWSLGRVSLPDGKVTSVLVRESVGRSGAPLGVDERVTRKAYPPGSKSRAFYAVNTATGIARRLSDALPENASSLRARLLHGRWLLVDQQGYRNGQPVYRLYGYNIPQGRFYPLTDWGPLAPLVSRQPSSPAGDLLLLEQTIRPENILRMFTSTFAGETWLLRLDERQLLTQAPTDPEEWKIKPGEECPTGG
jgi:hypothetical protein